MRYLIAGTMAALLVSTAVGQVKGGNVILSDDTKNDVDAAMIYATLHHLADRGEINIVGTVVDLPTLYSVAAAKAFNVYFGRPNLPLYADQRTAGADAPWVAQSSAPLGVVPAFNPNDSRANYGDCVAGIRTMLANLPAGQTTQFVETGSMYCIAQVMQSPADGISPLTGAALIKAKVSQLVWMGGAYPSGTEANFTIDSASVNYLFTNWTTQNGYPSSYGIPFATCNGTPASNSGPYQGVGANAFVDPTLEAFIVYGTNLRATWDSCAVLFAARGFNSVVQTNGFPVSTTLFADTGNGTNTVNASTGANSWSSSTASGQHYLTQSGADAAFGSILDGYQYAGFGGLPPGQGGLGAVIK